jgi:ubiquinone/menaquinone biosynthesis C-methylase UbiE
MATAGEICSAYKNCLAEATRFLKTSGYQVDYKEFQFTSKNAELTIKCSEPLYFQKWPYRGTSRRSETVDIVAEIEETIRLSDRKCTRATAFPKIWPAISPNFFFGRSR